jgi:diguanylate cyclase (GGDEF)-like protein
MRLLAALVYWVIVAVWLTVLAVVVFFFRRNPRIFGTTRLLLAVIAIDTARNIVENTYFGAYFGAQYGVLPAGLGTVLGYPALLILPKLINIAAGGLVLSILLLHWLPKAVRERTTSDERTEELSVLAAIDGMTGLFNRRHFMTAADVELERFGRYGRPLSMLMADIDNFKSVNDRYGHAVGDQVIVAIAGVLKQMTRNTDVVGRLGGEEFGLLLPETSLEEACRLAERLRAAAAALRVAYPGGELTVTVSLGAAQAVAGTSIAALTQQADTALYQAKRTGRNRVCTFDEPDIVEAAAPSLAVQPV